MKMFCFIGSFFQGCGEEDERDSLLKMIIELWGGQFEGLDIHLAG